MDAVKAKRILFALRSLIVLCAIFLVISFGCSAGHLLLKRSTYRKLTDMSAATDLAQRKTSYISAIRLDPAKPDAYIKLLSAYAEDGILQKQESEEFLSIYNALHHKLRKRSAGYAEVQKQTGFLYINGYEEATTTCIRMALPFLEEAFAYISDEDPEKQTVICYCRIGSYYKDYIWNAASVREISPEIMDALLSDIENTLDVFHQQQDGSVVYDYLGFSVAVCNLLYDQRNVLAATVPSDRSVGILDSIYGNLPEPQTLQKERTKQLLETLTGNRNNYYDMLQRAYERGQSG